MILDRETRFSERQPVTGNATSIDIYDAKQDRDIGIGEPMAISLDSHTVSGSSGTVMASIQTADNSSFTKNPVVLAEIDISGGGNESRKVFLLPKDGTVGRFIRIRYSRQSGDRAVSVSAHLLHASGVDARGKYYPRGYSVA